jgi:hypothetical protein
MRGLPRRLAAGAQRINSGPCTRTADSPSILGTKDSQLHVAGAPCVAPSTWVPLHTRRTPGHLSIALIEIMLNAVGRAQLVDDVPDTIPRLHSYLPSSDSAHSESHRRRLVGSRSSSSCQRHIARQNHRHGPVRTPRNPPHLRRGCLSDASWASYTGVSCTLHRAPRRCRAGCLHGC